MLLGARSESRNLRTKFVAIVKKGNKELDHKVLTYPGACKKRNKRSRLSQNSNQFYNLDNEQR